MKKRCLYSLAGKLTSHLMQMLLIVLLARVLSKEAFGLWGMFSHMTLLIGMLDGGLGGGGLRNALIEEVSEEKRKQLFFATFYRIGAIYLLFVFLCLWALHPLLQWLLVVQDSELKKMLPLLGFSFAVFMGIKASFSLYISGFYAFQEDKKKAFLDMAEALLPLLFVGGLVFCNCRFLWLYAGYYGVLASVTLAGFFWFIKIRGWKFLKPSWKEGGNLLQPLFSIHRDFWLQNILSLALFTSLPYLLVRVVSLKEVGPHLFLYRGCCFFIGLHFAVLNPLWASYTKALQERKILWMEKTLFLSLIGTLGMCLGFSCFLLFLHPHILQIGISRFIKCPEWVVGYTVWMTLYASINCLAIFLNACNRVKRQNLFLFFGTLMQWLLARQVQDVSSLLWVSGLALCPLLLSNILEVSLLRRYYHRRN